jgi:Ni,Fe-hydrogenase III small subunit
MANWVLKGLQTGIRTTTYPHRPEAAAGVSPGRPLGAALVSSDQIESLVERCPTRAIQRHEGGVALDHRRCVHCLRCRRDEGANLSWDSSYEWAAHRDDDMAPAQKLQRIFGRSLHIRFVDAGACGACMSEARQINNPYYNAHRLGFFMTPTPRNADVLMVSGPVSDAMRLPLRKTYDAMPEPKRVVAIGACAIFGGVFGTTFAASGGAGEIVPVDVVVPGCPPPPLAILHALLLLVERKPPSPSISPPPEPIKEPA